MMIIQSATIGGIAIILSRMVTGGSATYFIVDEYTGQRSTWSKSYKNEQEARDAANARWMLARSETPAYRQTLKSQVRPEVTAGFWEIEGTIYKVIRSQTSGNLYGKRLDVDPDGTQTWTYTPRAVAEIRQYGTRVQGDTVKKYGELYGRCMLCGRRLTNEESISEGIGPVCSGKVQW